MKDENSVPAAQNMTDVSLSIFRSKFKKNADSDDRLQTIRNTMPSQQSSKTKSGQISSNVCLVSSISLVVAGGLSTTCGPAEAMSSPSPTTPKMSTRNSYGSI